MVNNFDFKQYNNHYPTINKNRSTKAEKIKLVLEQHISELGSCVVADLGCSNGIITSYLSSFVKKIYGFDIEISQIDKNIDLRPDNCSFIQSNIINLPLENESVDVVICNHVYQWVDNHDLLLQEINRILKPNGSVYFSGPTRFTIYGENKVYFAAIFPIKIRKFWLKLWKGKILYPLNYLYPIQIVRLFRDYDKIVVFPFFLGINFNSKFLWKIGNSINIISPTAVYLFKKK